MLALKSFEWPHFYVGAGFIRNLVWDHLHSFTHSPPNDDVDILYFDPVHTDPETDYHYEAHMTSKFPHIPWSVRNQARMHIRNGDQAYSSMGDALAHWLETPTSVCVRLDSHHNFHLYATYGLEDLFVMILRPTPRGYERIETLRDRAHNKGWLKRWPLVTFPDDHKPQCQPIHYREVIENGSKFWR